MDANKWLSDWLTAHGMPGVKHMRREDIVRALDAYAAERSRSAYEAACKAVCSRCEKGIEVRRNEIGEWVHGFQNAPCYAHNIRTLMSETPPGLEFDADYAAIIKQRLAADNKETTNE